MAHQACGRSIIQTIMAPSLSTQTGIILRQCATLQYRDAPTLLVGDGVSMRRSFSQSIVAKRSTARSNASATAKSKEARINDRASYVSTGL